MQAILVLSRATCFARFIVSSMSNTWGFFEMVPKSSLLVSVRFIVTHNIWLFESAIV